jgi:transcriptional regulator with PAS, ATPase and Fis domain
MAYLSGGAIHYHSPRRNGPFITIDYAGFPESLLESELFGYERGGLYGCGALAGGEVYVLSAGRAYAANNII